MANDSTGPDDEVVEGSWSPRRPKASSKATSKSAKSDGGTPDPDVLVEEIEQTREELAETLDAIADKVSPKRVADRTKKAAKDGANDAVESVKATASDAADKAKETASQAADKASQAADTVKDKVAEVKEKVSGDGDTPRSPLAPATSVELDAATPVPGAEVPLEPAPTPGALADASFVAVEPVGTEAPIYTTTLPPQEPSRMPLVAGAGAALALVLLVRTRRRRSGRRR